MSDMLILRACPRCGGDLSLEADTRTTYLECVQCGHIANHAQERALGLRTTRRGVFHVLRGEAVTATNRAGGTVAGH